jgi:LemA protein
MTVVILIVAAVLLIYVFATYNSFVAKRNRIKEASSEIEVQLKRRYDLIPNLVETVKAYAVHERSVFENVAKARSFAMAQEGAVLTKTDAESALTQALKSLFAVSENYPELKANENFLKLQAEIADTENKIAASRRFYNTNVLSNNIMLEKFPSNLIGRAFGFKAGEFFKVDEQEQELAKQAPVLKF